MQKCRAFFVLYNIKVLRLIINNYMKFPETLNDIPLKNYQNFVQIEEPTNEDLIKELLGITQIQLNKFKAHQVNALVVHLNNLFKQEYRFIPRFKLNGIEYGFIPELDDISYGENTDLVNNINDYQTMHKAMAVAYRPVKIKQRGKYTIKEYENTTIRENAEIMKDAPLDVVMGMVVFFYNLTNELLKLIPNYIAQEADKALNEGLISAENGDHIQKYILSLKETLGGLTKLQNLNLQPV